LNSLSTHFLACLAGLAFGLGSTQPETYVSALFCFLGVVCFLALNLSNPLPKISAWIFGLAFHLSAFYWLSQTLERFGGFPSWVALVIFGLFAALSALQFPLFSFLVSRFSSRLSSQKGNTEIFEKKGLVAISKVFVLTATWSFVDYFFPKLFPWRFIYTQIVWPGIPSWASVVGPFVLETLFIFLALAAIQSIGRGDLLAKLWPVTSLVVLCVVGVFIEANIQLRIEEAPKLKVAIIQGNLSANEKGDTSWIELSKSRA